MQAISSGFWVLAQQTAPQGSSIGAMIPVVLIVLIFYFLLYRPMRTRQKKLDAMIASLKNGDKVITNGGLYGTVKGVTESVIQLRVAEGVTVEIAKNAVASLQAPKTKEE